MQHLMSQEMIRLRCILCTRLLLWLKSNGKMFCWIKGGGITATVHQRNNCISNQVTRSKENLWRFRASANEWVPAIYAPMVFPTKPAAAKQSDIQLIRQKRIFEEGNISVPICTGNLIQWCPFSEGQGKAGISELTFKVRNRMPASTWEHSICGRKMTCSQSTSEHLSLVSMSSFSDVKFFGLGVIQSYISKMLLVLFVSKHLMNV